jgi:hypothetical protein
MPKATGIWGKAVARAVFLVSCLAGFPQTGSTLPDPGPQNSRIVHNNDGSLTATVFAYDRSLLQYPILKINEEYGWGVNYEDAPTVNASELIDENADLRRLKPGFHLELQDGLFPKTVPFFSTFTELDRSHADKKTVLQKLIADYNSSPNPGKFRLARTAQNNDVVIGAKYKSESGREVEYKPILDCPISLVISHSELHDALELVAEQVNKSCTNDLHAQLTAMFASDELPFGGLARDMSVTGTIFGNFRNEAARDVIEDLLRQEWDTLYYSANYAPGINAYYLVIWHATRKAVGVEGNEIDEPIRNERIANVN